MLGERPAKTAEATDPNPDVEACLRELYGIVGDYERLHGELDENWHVRATSGSSYVLKIMRPDCDPGLIEMQCGLLERLRTSASGVAAQQVVRTKNGEPFASIVDASGRQRYVWMLIYIDGRPWAEVRPITSPLLRELGACLGSMDEALRDFDHPALKRILKWDLRNADWIGQHLDLLDPEVGELVAPVVAHFTEQLRPAMDRLPLVPIHNDANDYNLLVTHGADGAPSLAAVIDFGDCIRSNRVCELAIAAAYALFDSSDPVRALGDLVSAYHQIAPLEEAEIEMLFPLVRTRLATSLVNSVIEKRAKPDDPYVVISEAPARRLLQRLGKLDAKAVCIFLREACGQPGLPEAGRIVTWLERNKGEFGPVLGLPGADLGEAALVDLSIDGAPLAPFEHDPSRLQRVVDEALTGATVGLGRYGECRLVYSDDCFWEGERVTDRRRTRHLGVDIFAPAGTAVMAPLEGTVLHVANCAREQDYGGLLVLEHRTKEGDAFYTLYGHLSPESIAQHQVGDPIAAAVPIAVIGTDSENGNWPPHLHFQLLTTMPAAGPEAPGACYADDTAWQQISPNPAPLLGLDASRTAAPADPEGEILARRKRLLGGNLSLSYRDPLHIVRGYRQYLFDETGRCYIDTYNNVPHVGHCHPHVIAAIERQQRVLNTNTRYLHDNILDYAERLCAKLPPRLSVCFFVNSASEGNELALRLARAYTGAKDVIVMDTAYHGHTTSLIDISPYKFDKPAGSGAPEWVHKTPTCDPYRGAYRYDDPQAGPKYAAHVAEAAAAIEAQGRTLSAYFCETLPSVGGQIIPPPGFMQAAFQAVRQAGGVCVADEVQAGFGRVGSHFWAFEMQGAEPDILVLGKPIGNGHPLAAVVTTPEIAAAFDNGIEFFSTFGGNTVSCAAGLAVLEVLDDEGLQAHAERVGRRLLDGLEALKADFEIIGDVRGAGLFIGVELVRDRESLEPAERQASYVKNRMCERGILLGTDGPYDNVLKIRPPMVFDYANADQLVATLGDILRERGAQA